MEQTKQVRDFFSLLRALILLTGLLLLDNIGKVNVKSDLWNIVTLHQIPLNCMFCFSKQNSQRQYSRCAYTVSVQKLYLCKYRIHFPDRVFRLVPKLHYKSAKPHLLMPHIYERGSRWLWLPSSSSLPPALHSKGPEGSLVFPLIFSLHYLPSLPPVTKDTAAVLSAFFLLLLLFL